MSKKQKTVETKLAHLGRDPKAFHGAVNPPVYHASTILFDNLERFEERNLHFKKDAFTYARYGTPTTRALEETVADLEGGADCVTLPSGLAAVATAYLSLVQTGDHILVSDNVYLPNRRFCDHQLSRFNVETTYYDPEIGADIETLFRPNTRLICLESPGSYSFEVQDLPRICALARARGIKVLLDNTWGALLCCRPFELGVDLSIHSATKYISGHADAMLGLIVATEELAPALRRTAFAYGQCAGPDDIYMALRGLRTLAVRLPRHQENSLAMAQWLAARPEVHEVLHPALPSCPGHEFWRRDFTGANGLFGVVLAKPYSKAALAAMLEGMAYFGIGASWGGFESLMTVVYPEKQRVASTWDKPGPTLRIHAGLENIDDLLADLAAGLERLEAAAGNQHP